MPTCTCSNCSQHLEFDAVHAGAVITCPTCHRETRLFIPDDIRQGPEVPAAPKGPPPRKRPPPRNPTKYNKPQATPAVPEPPGTVFWTGFGVDNTAPTTSPIPKIPEAAKPAQPPPQSPASEDMLRRLNAEAHDAPLIPIPDSKATRFGATLDEVVPALVAAGAAARAASPASEACQAEIRASGILLTAAPLACQAEALGRIRAATCYSPLRKLVSTAESVLFFIAAIAALYGIAVAVDESKKGNPGLVVVALAGWGVGGLLLGFAARAAKLAALLVIDIADCQVQQVARLRRERTD